MSISWGKDLAVVLLAMADFVLKVFYQVLLFPESTLKLMGLVHFLVSIRCEACCAILLRGSRIWKISLTVAVNRGERTTFVHDIDNGRFIRRDVPHSYLNSCLHLPYFLVWQAFSLQLINRFHCLLPFNIIPVFFTVLGRFQPFLTFLVQRFFVGELVL